MMCLELVWARQALLRTRVIHPRRESKMCGCSSGPGLRRSRDSPTAELKVHQFGRRATQGAQVHRPGSSVHSGPDGPRTAGINKPEEPGLRGSLPWPTCREPPVGRGRPPSSMPTVWGRGGCCLPPLHRRFLPCKTGSFEELLTSPHEPRYPLR